MSHIKSMKTVSSLAEIERAADVLRTEEKQEVVMFLLPRLRGEVGVLPPVRDIPKEQIEKWVAEDEAGYGHLVRQRRTPLRSKLPKSLEPI